MQHLNTHVRSTSKEEVDTGAAAAAADDPWAKEGWQEEAARQHALVAEHLRLIKKADERKAAARARGEVVETEGFAPEGGADISFKGSELGGFKVLNKEELAQAQIELAALCQTSGVPKRMARRLIGDLKTSQPSPDSGFSAYLFKVTRQSFLSEFIGMLDIEEGSPAYHFLIKFGVKPEEFPELRAKRPEFIQRYQARLKQRILPFRLPTLIDVVREETHAAIGRPAEQSPYKVIISEQFRSLLLLRDENGNDLDIMSFSEKEREDLAQRYQEAFLACNIPRKHVFESADMVRRLSLLLAPKKPINSVFFKKYAYPTAVYERWWRENRSKLPRFDGFQMNTALVQLIRLMEVQEIDFSHQLWLKEALDWLGKDTNYLLYRRLRQVFFREFSLIMDITPGSPSYHWALSLGAILHDELLTPEEKEELLQQRAARKEFEDETRAEDEEKHLNFSLVPFQMPPIAEAMSSTVKDKASIKPGKLKIEKKVELASGASEPMELEVKEHPLLESSAEDDAFLHPRLYLPKWRLTKARSSYLSKAKGSEDHTLIEDKRSGEALESEEKKKKRNSKRRT